jgi:hypothetical protein
VISFSNRPCKMITLNDSVTFNWKIRGASTLLFSIENADDDENPGKEYLSYKLVASKGHKEAFSTIELTLLNDTSIDYIPINTVRHGDSAVAIGTKDTLLWGDKFILSKISSNSKRAITVTHFSRSVELDAAGNESSAFSGLANSGPWEIRTLLSPEEIKDTALIPSRLVIKTIIIYK